MLKNPCNSTGFYLNSHDCTFNHKVRSGRRLASHTKGCEVSQGKPFSACLPPVN